MKNTIEMIEHLEIEMSLEEIANTPKDEWKRKVKYQIRDKEEKEFEEFKQKSKKCKKIETSIGIGMKEYLKELDPEEAMIILLTRLGMVDIRENYPNKYKRDLRSPH